MKLSNPLNNGKREPRIVERSVRRLQGLVEPYNLNDTFLHDIIYEWNLRF